VQLPSPEYRAIENIMCKNIVDPERPEMTVCRTRIASWVPEATNTQMEYVLLIAFSLKQ
jgi:hypothetical protein